MNKFICDQTGDQADPTTYGMPPATWFSVHSMKGGEPVRHFSSERAVAEFYAAKAGLNLVIDLVEAEARG